MTFAHYMCTLKICMQDRLNTSLSNKIGSHYVVVSGRDYDDTYIATYIAI